MASVARKSASVRGLLRCGMPKFGSTSAAATRTTSFSAGYATQAKNKIKIVEVGARDGLQNEKKALPVELKVELIYKLVEAGLRTVESGSFVSPKWVPQMASTDKVLSSSTLKELRKRYGHDLSLPVLVPNSRGMDGLLPLLEQDKSAQVPDEIAVFVSASEGFSKANLNCSIAESVDKLAPVVSRAKEAGLKIRGYVSVVLGCPFDGKVDPKQVATVSQTLLDLGCYEVSLGDTIGVGTPAGWQSLLAEVFKKADSSKLAAHCHDTYGTAVASILTAVQLGIKTVDSSIGGLGGCPYSPGATGNVATEDVVYALESSGFSTGVLPGEARDDLLGEGTRAQAFSHLARIGDWISQELGRPNASRAGRAALARQARLAKL